MGCTGSKDTQQVSTPEPPSEDPIKVQKRAQEEERKTKQAAMAAQLESLPEFVPNPGFVVKTKRTTTAQKIFVNVMHHECIPHVADAADAAGTTRPPFLTKDEKWMVDKKGEQNMTYRAVLSTKLYEDIINEPALLQETCYSILNLLNEIYPMANLDLDYRLPKINKGFIGEEIEPIRGGNAEEAGAAAAAAVASKSTGTVANTTSASTVASAAPTAAPTKPHLVVQKTLIEERQRQLVVPPKMRGWLKKRGHIVMNWKTRYFVLDSGYLTYFVDQSDEPPYGKDKKGQLCMAGFRDAETAATTPEITTNPEKLQLLKDFQQRCANKGETGNNDQLRLNLVLFDATAQQGAESVDQADYKEMILEAASAEEKAAWTAAIKAHTFYIESSLQISAELAAQNGGTTTTGAGAGSESAAGLTSSAPAIASTVPTVTSPTNDPKRWMVFLEKKGKPAVVSANGTEYSKAIKGAERIVLTGLVNKPNPVGATHMRQLIFTTHKRLIYVDPDSMEQKGEIDWHTQSGVEHFVKSINATTFEIHHADEKNKIYKFITKDDLTAKQWVDAIGSVRL